MIRIGRRDSSRIASFFAMTFTCGVIERAREALIGLSAVLGVLAIVPLSAEAAFPGINGHIAYARGGAGTAGIYVTDVGRVSFGGHSYSVWSPDGTKIAFYSFDTGNIIVANADGTNARSIANLGAVSSYLSWDPSGENIWFRKVTNGNPEGIWKARVAGGGVTPVLQDATALTAGSLNWSARSDDYPKGRLVYDCVFRSGRRDLCIYEPPAGSTEIGGGTTRLLPIDNQDYPYEPLPNWSPDGRKILYRIFLPPRTFTFPNPLQGTVSISESHVFSMSADGGGVTQLTQHQIPDISGCPDNAEIPITSVVGPVYSPDGSSIVMYAAGIRLRLNANNGFCDLLGTEGGIYTMSAGGGTPSLLVPGGYFPDWQPLPADLTVIIDDGHGHPLDGLKVQVRNPETGSIILENPIHNGNGIYLFEDVPAGPWVVRTTLEDFKNEPGFTPAFEIRHNPQPDEAAWAEYSVTVPPTGGTIARLPFEEQLFVPADAPPLIASSVAQFDWYRLDDMAAIYYQLQRYVAWVKRTLTPITGDRVELYAFADSDPTSGDSVDQDIAYYRYSRSEMVYGTEFSRYEYRDGVYSRGYGDEAPENGEWHEYNHHLWGTFIDPALNGCSGINHGGYKNPDTCDSMNEGLAAFLAAAAAHDLDGASDSFYDALWDIEPPVKAWSSRTGSSGRRSNAEDLAVSALLWDLYDSNADANSTQVIAQDGSHQAVTYTDQESSPIGELWTHIANARPRTVYDLRVSYGTPALTIDLDEDGVNDIAPIDQVFLMQGFFPIDRDQTLTSSHKTYHYDVNYAQRVLPTAPRNAVIGVTSHRAFSADGTVTGEIIPRFHITSDPSANVAINVQDASGSPLAGAEIDLVIQYPGQQQSVSTRRLDSGDANLAYLELAPYFDYLLPDDAPLPDCDPANDVQVTVTVKARVNGYESADQPSFDNCTYQRAVAAATGPAALSVTTTFPEDSTPPESTIDTVPSDTLVGTATRGFWTVRLACNDPADSGFAAGCARIEYRLDGGANTTYERSVRVTGVGQHTFEYRSVDAAGNEEAWRSVALDIVEVDTDNDGLSDSAEASLGTDPNDPDSDDDTVNDGDEVSFGTNPLDADSDDDGLNDGQEFQRGTDALDADSDDDTLSDGAEVTAGTDPLDADSDNDGVQDGPDNCRLVANAGQENYDGDSAGDACDSDDDNDGVADASDIFPRSDLRATVIIKACNSGVPNRATGSGAVMNDEIGQCAQTSTTKRQFERCVTSRTAGWKRNGLLSLAEKKAIDSCAKSQPFP